MDSHDIPMTAESQNGIQHKLESTELRRRFGFTAAPVDKPAAQSAVADLLRAIGEDPRRRGLRDTPKRVAQAYQELVSGYTTDPATMLNNAIFDIDYDELIIVSDIKYASLCEHHLLPFIGQAHVAYLPKGKIVGLSKIPRIVDMFSRRLQIQERLTRQIAAFLDEVLQPRGVAVVMSAQHMCSVIRGVKKHDSNMITSAMLGDFKQDRHLRQEFMLHISRANSQ